MAKRSVVEYMGHVIRLCEDGLYALDDSFAVGDNPRSGLNLVGAKSIVLARVQRERHRREWGWPDDYELVYLIEVGKAHYQMKDKWGTLCGIARQDWLRCLPMELGACTICKSCVSIFGKRVL